MPIYEFYCRKCNTIYSFFSRSVNTEKIPFCPSCRKVKLQRRMSVFAKISPKKEDVDSGDLAGFDEAKMEKAMEMLTQEAGGIDENDPRQAAQLMRKLTDATGLSLGPKMEEALSRMESGEDPEKIEAEMGDSISDDELFIMAKKAAAGKKEKKPKVDEKLYDL
ncbi:MAG TPA: zinc ribbon domain-containing protein [Syntrophales bacterium]|nr:zinc ribbon domain-containing protein [Syntrophales bacterium]